MLIDWDQGVILGGTADYPAAADVKAGVIYGSGAYTGTFGTGTSGDPIRQRIMDAVKARFALILISNGYNTDVGSNVFEQKAEPFQESEIPGMNIRESETPKMDTVGAEVHPMVFEVFAIDNGDASPAALRNIWADIIIAIGLDRTWGGLAQDTSLPEVGTADTVIAEKTVAGARISFTVTYSTGLMDPYA
jgi:hypothetical protein